jgi:hypothetical protein
MLFAKESPMADAGFEAEKERLIDAITDAYSRGDMEMAAFERAVGRITMSPDSSALAAEAAALGQALGPAFAPALRPVLGSSPVLPARDSGNFGGSIEAASDSLDLVELACVSGSLKQDGEWVRAERYRLYLKSSSARLDLREYEGRRRFRLHVELDAISSSLRIDLPEGFELQDRISERQSSTVRNKPKGSVFDDCIILLTGSIRSSTVKIKYR